MKSKSQINIEFIRGKIINSKTSLSSRYDCITWNSAISKYHTSTYSSFTISTYCSWNCTIIKRYIAFSAISIGSLTRSCWILSDSFIWRCQSVSFKKKFHSTIKIIWFLTQYSCAIHARRVTIMPRDINLARRIRGNN